VARFYREGSAAKRIEHDNTVRFLGRGEDAGIHYLVMELLDGRCLADVVAAELRLDQVRAASIMVQVLSALAVAHERGIVHRDIKPENIMVRGKPGDGMGEQAKLLDFGIAKRVARPAGVEDSFNMEELTACGAIIGTPEYMAPEQCRGQEVDARTDVYAAGVVLYRLITGDLPFTAAHPLEVCQLHLGEAPRPPSAVWPGIHPAIERTILRAMSKDPAARQQSAGALRAELLEALAEIADEAPESTAVMIRPLPLPAAPPPAPIRVVLPPAPAHAYTRVAVRPAPRPSFRGYLPTVAVFAALGAGVASLALTLSTLVH
jgi:serine/threonine-protein kinase